MTLNSAHSKAKSQSKSLACDMYVVCDGEDGWQVASSFDLDTYYLGAMVEAHYFCGDQQP